MRLGGGDSENYLRICDRCAQTHALIHNLVCATPGRVGAWPSTIAMCRGAHCRET